jgi:hypothetical protein
MNGTGNGLCKTVASGGVGESGATSQLFHTVQGNTQKILILRVTESSLCPNTGAVGLLVVNGLPQTSGTLSKSQCLQVEASPGDRISALVHTVPLFNGVLCIRLGELSFDLQECEHETAVTNLGGQIGGAGKMPIATRDWYAWNNLMPPKPDVFHVTGEVEVQNPGTDLWLLPKIPQGINPRILLMDLIVKSPGGSAPEVIWKTVSYEKPKITYDRVHIFYNGNLLVDLPVEDIH